MFSLLTGELPDKVRVYGQEFPIYTDFRRWIQAETLLFEEEGTFAKKIPMLLHLCYPVLPETLDLAMLGVATFYAGGELSAGKQKKKEIVFNFRQDEALIYAGFYQQYGIDLTKEALHWWQFKALLSGLSEETKFMQIVGYRAVDISAIKNPEEQKFYRKMKNRYRLQDKRTEEEKAAAVGEAIANLF